MKLRRTFLSALPIEHSLQFRAWTLGVVLIAVLAVLHEEEWPGFGWAVMALTGLGYALSYVRRGRPNWFLKTVICFVMLWAFADFWSNLADSANDPRIPLANLLLWLQCMHAFDLPHRQNLNVSFFVGLVLMSVAAVISTTSAFAWFLLAFMVASLFMLQHSYVSWQAEALARREQARDAERAPQPTALSAPLPLLRSIAWRSVGGLALAGLIAYVCIPHFQGMRIRTLPLSVAHHITQQTNGHVVNPAFPQGVDPGTGTRGGKTFDSNSYYGFNKYMDLTTRGHLSDEVVMRVRTSQWTYYRGLAFDQYDGRGWQMEDEGLEKVTASQPPIIIRPRYEAPEDLIQIFYLEKDMSNVMFGAYTITQVFYNGSVAWVDKANDVRADYPLEAGTTYSIISRVRRVDSRWRRFIMHGRHGHQVEDAEPYLQLPTTITPRTRQLALNLTANANSLFDKANYIAGYLQHNYEYSLDSPVPPQGTDAVDNFLFVSRQGACEEFASAFCVLCRAAGVPARVVVGYLPGTFNPFSGVYEVRAHDAHAWGEVLIPLVGWVSFDATPGADMTPGSDSGHRNEWILQSVGNWLYERLHLHRVKDWMAPRLSALGAWMDREVEQARTLMKQGLGGTLLVLAGGLALVVGVGLVVWALMVQPLRRIPAVASVLSRLEARLPKPA
ncbi:MAG: transglutaminase family protein, partial [Candidatus Xenobia bacterium]